jgi:glycosyltransferase involved in cell wall biosynthesis
MKYLIISPVKNEADFIEKTLLSVTRQTILPQKWIIVDDGSTDNTSIIIDEYLKKFNWIELLKNDTKNQERAGGAKVVRAFLKGYDKIKNVEHDFIVKLDGDLELPNNYFEEIINTFKSDSKIGICGGYILNKIGANLVKEIDIDYHVRGAFKSVRKNCYEEIGGFKEIWNWDGIDEMEAMFKGWKTKVIDLPVIHFRPTSAAYNPIKFNIKDGEDAYRLRSSFFLTIIRTIFRFARKPYLAVGISYFYGYIRSFIRRDKIIIDTELSKFINKFHLNRIKNKILK